ncbi:MAG: hypothetical protein AAF438_13055 [Pseudomonadota bacterium]
MDRQYIEQNHIVDRYLMGKLSDDEQAAFEAYYFEHPDMLEQVKMAKSMQETVKQQADSLVTPVPAPTMQPGVLERLFPPQIGFALSLLLGLGLIGLLLRSDPTVTTPDVQVLPAVDLIQSRGSDSAPRVRVVEGLGGLILRMELGAIGYEAVRLELRPENDDAIWHGPAAVSPPIGAVNVMVNTELSVGVYELLVFATQNPDVPLQVFTFEVVSP